MLPQYYSVQAPWGLYPTAGNQGALVRAQTPRSLTPSQDGGGSGGGLATPTGSMGPPQLGTPGR